MSKTIINNNSGKLSFSAILTLVFVIAKLSGHLDWSWLWVFSPLWLPLTVILGVISVIALLIGVTTMYDDRQRRLRKKARG